MSQVHIPPVFDGSGALVEATVDIRLITVDGKPCICFNATELATEYQAVTMPMGEGSDGLIVALAPQILLARPDGSATWYQVSVRTRHRTEIYRVQVPDVPGVLDLRDLVGASAITADDVLSGRLLPYPGDVADGWSLTVADGAAVWAEPAAGGAGSEVHTITADLVLSAASASHQIIASDVPFVRVLLPAANTLAVGDQFRIDNIGSDNKVLANSSGTSLGMITVGSSVVCTVARIATPDDGWVIDYRANNPVIVSLMSPSIAMAHGDYVAPDILPLSASKSLYSHAYYEPSMETYLSSFVVLDTSGKEILFSDPSLVDLGADDQKKYASCALSETRGMYVAYGGYITVVDMVGATVTVAASGNSLIKEIRCLVPLSSTRVVAFGVKEDNLDYAVLLTVSGNSVTAGTPVLLDLGFASPSPSIAIYGSLMSATSILACFHHTQGEDRIAIIDVAGDVLSLGQVTEFGVYMGGKVAMNCAFAQGIGYAEGIDQYGQGNRRSITIANGMITLGEVTAFYCTSGSTQHSVLDDSSKIFSVWQSSGLRAQKYLIDPTPITGGVMPSGSENRFSLDTVTILAMARYSARSVLILDSAYNLRSLVMM